jgi:hypothetical protein
MQQIEECWNIPVAKQILIYKGKQLNPKQSLLEQTFANKICLPWIKTYKTTLFLHSLSIPSDETAAK